MFVILAHTPAAFTMSNDNKPRAGVFRGAMKHPHSISIARITRWEWDGIEAVAAKSGISRERVVEKAVRLLLKSNGITGPKTPPPSSPIIRVVSLVCR